MDKNNKNEATITLRLGVDYRDPEIYRPEYNVNQSGWQELRGWFQWLRSPYMKDVWRE